MSVIQQSNEGVQAACKALAALESSPAQAELRIDGDSIALPETVLRPVKAVLSLLASGKMVRIEEEREELSTQQAAERLNVSRTHLIELLEEGAIPYRKVGTHRRVRTEDVLAYKEAAYRQSQDMLKQLTEEAQVLGLYD